MYDEESGVIDHNMSSAMDGFNYVALHDLETIGRNMKDFPEALWSEFRLFVTKILEQAQNAGPHTRRQV